MDCIITNHFRLCDSAFASKTVEPTHIDIYNLSTEVNDDFDCVPLDTDHKPTICLYSDVEDVFVSKEIRHDGIWEGAIVKKAFRSILLNDPHLGFIDIGANLGLYSLVAASMGHNVISVEPFDNNLRRFRKSISIGE